jgi:Fe-S-cluster containining protein
MLNRYERFLKEFDKKLRKYFTEQSEYICCKEGCSGCCEVGDYPFTQLEMMYLMEGFKNLPTEIKIQVKSNLDKIKQNRFSTHLFYKCPFLINNRCSVYKYRGITCRTFGLAYLINKKTVKTPECVNEGLCYSKVYENGVLTVEPVKENLNLFEITSSNLAKKYKLEFGQSRSLIDWFP